MFSAPSFDIGKQALFNFADLLLGLACIADRVMIYATNAFVATCRVGNCLLFTINV